MAEPASFVRPPVALVWAAAAGLVAGIVMAFVGSVQTGVSVDEPVHIKRLQNYIESGYYVRKPEIERAGPGVIPVYAYVYGPVTTGTMHAANVLLGNEGLVEVVWSKDAFTVRHVVVAALSMGGLLGVGVIAGLLLGSWRWGVVAAAVLAAIPMWTGHAMFNLKDTPVAVGNTVLTAGLMAVALNRHRLLGLIAMVPGIVLMVGTRPGMWAAVVAGVLAVLLFLGIGRKLDAATVGGLAASLAAGYGGLLAVYPRIFGHPITMVLNSTSDSANFGHSHHLNVGRMYALDRTIIEWPLLLLAFLVIGTAVAIVVGVRSMISDGRRAAALAVVGVQAFALTLVAIAMNTNLYNGLRQLLFAVPAQAVLATLGMAVVATFVAGKSRRMAVAFAVVAVAAILLPTIVQARLYPYQYTYANVAAELAGADADNDYWETSFRVFANDVPPTVKATCPHFATATTPVDPDLYLDCRSGWSTFKMYWLDRWGHTRTDPDSPYFYALVRDASGIPPNCQQVDAVQRYRNIARVTISRLLFCKAQAS